MRILITNTKLGGRGGSEAFVRDLARGLQAGGHSVIAFTSDPREGERLLESDVIPVATDLANLPFRPDVIHAQHHLDAMTALLALPGVPALYHCHGAVWREAIPRHPRIYRYLAVARTLAERLIVESNLEPDTVTVQLNGVDLARFSTVRAPRPRPARALFYNSRHDPAGDTVQAVRAAAAVRGIELECAGTPFGQFVTRPERELPQYDLVFASGISAIEAMASGCAVIVLGRTSCGELVRPDNYDRYREVNFSIAVNSAPSSAQAIGAEIDRYAAVDVVATTERLRQDADFRVQVDRLLGLYDDVISAHRRAPEDLRAESVAASAYLQRLVPLIKMTDHRLNGEWAAPGRSTTFDELRAELVLLKNRIESAVS